MVRKGIVESNDSKKFSVNIITENLNALEKVAANMDMKTGPFINLLIQNTCRMPDKMRNTILEFLKMKCKELNTLMCIAGEFEKRALQEEKEMYFEFAQILNYGITVDFEDSDPTMQESRMKNGTLIIPKDWIILNPEDAKDCEYAGVVECRNGEKYGVPHFCFYTNYKDACDYETSFLKKIRQLCCEKWPEFSDIMKKEVRLIPDPDNAGSYLNLEEHLASPVIGFFSIPRTDELTFEYDTPYGAFISSDFF